MSLGVRGKLLLAVTAVAAMTVVASVVSWHFYQRMERQLTLLLDDNIPSISVSLRLAEASANYASGAIGLGAVQNNVQRQNVDIAMRQQAVTLRRLLARLQGMGMAPELVAETAERVAALERQLTDLNLLIEHRLNQERLRREALTATNRAIDGLSTALAAAGDQPGQARAAAAALILAGHLLEAANSDAVNRLNILRPLVAAAVGNLALAVADMPVNPQSQAITNALSALDAKKVGNLIDRHDDVVQLHRQTDNLMRATRDTASRLSITVAKLVETAEQRSEEIRGHAGHEVEVARWSLLAIALATFIGPVGFVWVLMGRQIVTPLTTLTAAARAIAVGNHRAEIPRLGGDEVGQMAAALMVFRDAMAKLSERTLALAASQDRLRSILDAAVYPVLIVDISDDDANILYCNHEAITLFDLPEDADNAIPDREMRFPDQDAWAAIKEELWPNRRLVNVEMTVHRRDGGWLWALVSAVPMSYQERPAVLVSFNDITERKHAEEQLRQTRDEATAALESLRLAQEHLVQSEKMASLGQLVAGIAHEINTPLGIALTSASYLSDETRRLGNLSANQQMRKADFERYMSTAQETSQLLMMNVTRAADLVQSFKQVSADQTSDSRRIFDLKNYIDDVMLSLKPSWKKAGHEVVATCPEGVEIDGFPGVISQILANLLMNALVHAYDDGQAGRMSIDIRSLPDDMIEMAFGDDGKGIPLANQNKIFDPFFTTRRGAGSTGLGLNIVYNLVTRHLGGRIRIDSVTGQGTRFTMVFPRVAPERPPERA